jgi:hypothetical protein
MLLVQLVYLIVLTVLLLFIVFLDLFCPFLVALGPLMVCFAQPQVQLVLVALQDPIASPAHNTFFVQ